jgi:hypothetical protein
MGGDPSVIQADVSRRNTNAETRAAIVLRAEQVSRDYQRRGFSRIGLLPVVVLSGVTIEFRDLAHARDVLSRVTSRLPVGSAGEAVELRDVTILIPANIQSAPVEGPQEETNGQTSGSDRETCEIREQSWSGTLRWGIRHLPRCWA